MSESQQLQGSDVMGQGPDMAQSAPAEAQGAEQQPDSNVIQQLHREAAGYRKRLRELEETVKKFEAEKLTESERMQRRLAELEAQYSEAQRRLQENVVRYEVMLAASKHGLVDPEAAYRLLNLAALEFDDEGRPVNLEPLLKTLLREKPYLAGTGSGISTTNPARSGAAPTFKRSQLRDPAFFRQHREEIMRAFREGRIEED